jgi:outer membrane autotransporter protein
VVADLPNIVQGTRQNAILATLGNLSTSGLSLLAPRSAILGFALTNTGNSLGLTTKVDFAPSGLSGQSDAVGRAIADIQAKGSTRFLEALVPALVAQPDIASLDRSYRTVSAANASAIPQSTMDATNLAMTTITNQLDVWRIGDGSDRPLGTGAAGKPLIWATPAVVTASGDGNYASQIYGGSGGAQGQVHGTHVLLGGAISGSQSYFSTSAPSGSGNATNVGASLYGLAPIGKAYVSGILYGGGGSTTFNHSLSALAIPEAPSVALSNVMLGIRVEAGYKLRLAQTPAHVTPFVAIQPMQLWQGSGTESLAGFGSTLTYRQTSITALPLFLGAQLDGQFVLSNGAVLSPFVRLAWMHDFRPDRTVPRSFSSDPDFGFSGTGTPIVANAAVLHLGTAYAISSRITLTASIDSQLSPSFTSVGATGSFVYRW